MMMTQCKKVLSACAVVVILCAPSFAGTIQPGPVSSGPGLGLVQVPVVSTPTPNNDNVPTSGLPDNNIVVPLKRFDNNDYIDIEFTVSTSTGITEYKISESVDNNTGINWTGYRVQLGFGTGANFAMSPANDGLDFDAPDFDFPGPTSTSMGAGLASQDEIVFSGAQGTGLAVLNFRIDVPDGLTDGKFTLRQFPIPIPEPSTALMLVLGGIAAPVIMRRRAR
jgi:hypothetical protein